MTPKKRTLTIAVRTVLIVFCTQYLDSHGVAIKRHHALDTVKTSVYKPL